MTDASGLRITDIDADSLDALELGGLLCFHCPLLEDLRLPDPGPGSCRIRSADLTPLAVDPRSGIKAAVLRDRIVGYSVFGRPALFRNLDTLPFEVDPDALLVAALYATPGAADNIDVDLLVSVMDFARDRGYSDVAVVCRMQEEDAPEARGAMLEAAGFSLSGESGGLCLAVNTLENWDGGGEAES